MSTIPVEHPLVKQIHEALKDHALHITATSAALASLLTYDTNKTDTFDPKMKVLWMKRTCEIFPDQYEGKLEDGRMFYLRLRYQHVAADISIHPTDDLDDALEGIRMFGHECDLSTFNRTQIIELFKENGLDVDWKGCVYIDPYRLPHISNYSILGMIKQQFRYRTFGLRLKFNELKNSINYQSQLARKRSSSYHKGKR